MPEITLESLAQRVAILEQKVAQLNGVIPPTRDWRDVVGMFERNEFNQRIDDEIAAYRAAQKAEAEAEDEAA